MTDNLASSSNAGSRCRYRSSSGRRCKATIRNHKLDFCPKHAESVPLPQPPADFLHRLTTDSDEFSTALGIHNSLSELYKLLAADLISARRAAVLAYIANLLLRTIPIVQSELDPDSSSEVVPRIDFGDLPRPNRHPVPAGIESTERNFAGQS